MTTLRIGRNAGQSSTHTAMPERRISWRVLFTVALLCTAAPARSQPSQISEQEFTCLALNIYHEARNQPIEGQLAVAHVTLNRAELRAAATICEIVYNGWAFSWTRDPRKQRPPADQQAWTTAQTVARWALTDRDSDPVFGSTFFHAATIAPGWAPAKVRVKQIGDHVFYRDTRIPREERASAASDAIGNP